MSLEDRHMVWEGSLMGVRQNPWGYTTYYRVTTFWSDGTTTDREVPGKVVFLPRLEVGE